MNEHPSFKVSMYDSNYKINHIYFETIKSCSGYREVYFGND